MNHQDKHHLTEDFTVEQLKSLFLDPELWVAAGGYRFNHADYPFEALMGDPTAVVMLDFEGDEPVGYFVFKRTRAAEWSCHVGYKEQYRGKRAVKAAEEAATLMFFYGAQALYAAVPQDNERAAEFARLCGFKFIGFTPSAVMRHGQPVGINYFEKVRT